MVTAILQRYKNHEITSSVLLEWCESISVSMEVGVLGEWWLGGSEGGKRQVSPSLEWKVPEPPLCFLFPGP